MIWQPDESARERDVEIKMGFGSWLLFVWMVPICFGVIWFGTLVVTTVLRALFLVLAIGADNIGGYEQALALDNAALWIGRFPVLIFPLLIFIAPAAALGVRGWYRERVRSSA